MNQQGSSAWSSAQSQPPSLWGSDGGTYRSFPRVSALMYGNKTDQQQQQQQQQQQSGYPNFPYSVAGMVGQAPTNPPQQFRQQHMSPMNEVASPNSSGSWDFAKRFTWTLPNFSQPKHLSSVPEGPEEGEPGRRSMISFPRFRPFKPSRPPPPAPSAPSPLSSNNPISGSYYSQSGGAAERRFDGRQQTNVPVAYDPGLKPVVPGKAPSYFNDMCSWKLLAISLLLLIVGAIAGGTAAFLTTAAAQNVLANGVVTEAPTLSPTTPGATLPPTFAPTLATDSPTFRATKAPTFDD